VYSSSPVLDVLKLDLVPQPKSNGPRKSQARRKFWENVTCPHLEAM
jgi:hypothetical protein